MYTQPVFRMTEESEMAAFIAARRFANLVVSGPNGPQAAHLPMILRHDDSGRAVLEGHVARGNPVAAIAAAGVRALAIFNGADAYVTPAFYPSKREHGRVVPTWNYIAVQVAGELQTFSDPTGMRQHLAAITDMMEGDAASPWSVDDAPEEYVAKLINAIIGVRLAVETIEGARKLSQNKAENDRAGVQVGFAQSPSFAARELAREMIEPTQESPRR